MLIAKTLSKGLQVIEAVVEADASGGLTVRQISQTLDLPYATAYRLTYTLATEGYLECNNDHKIYSPGPRLIKFHGAIARRFNLGRQVCPSLLRLSERANEAVHLGVRSGNEVVYLDTVLTTLSSSRYAPAGARAPLHSTALGKALLAFSDDDVVHHILEDYKFEKFTPNTIVTKEALLSELEVIRSRGFAMDWDENVPHGRCIASIVVNEFEEPTAAISISAPPHRFESEQAVRETAEMLCGACRDASRALGGHLGPDPKLWYRELRG